MRALAGARELRLERVELSVLHDNAAARVLYERSGFVVEGRCVRDWKHDGVYRDSVLMALDTASLRGSPWTIDVDVRTEGPTDWSRHPCDESERRRRDGRDAEAAFVVPLTGPDRSHG